MSEQELCEGCGDLFPEAELSKSGHCEDCEHANAVSEDNPGNEDW